MHYPRCQAPPRAQPPTISNPLPIHNLSRQAPDLPSFRLTSATVSPHTGNYRGELIDCTFLILPYKSVDVIKSYPTMPATRRSTRGAARSAVSKQQSTLSFNHRVTKGSATKTGKDTKVLSPGPVQVEQPAKDQGVDVVEVEKQPEEVAPAQQEPQKTVTEARAEKISDAQVKRYWKGVEDARLAKRVHQEELSLPEKVLRYFDVSSQYGVGQTTVYLTFSSTCLRTSADNATALRRNSPHKSLVPSRETWPESPDRGPGCAAEGGETGKQGD